MISYPLQAFPADHAALPDPCVSRRFSEPIAAWSATAAWLKLGGRSADADAM